MTTDALASLIATLPPPWNTDVKHAAVFVESQSQLVERFDAKPTRPSRWTDLCEDADGETYPCERRRKTRAEWREDLEEYEHDLAAWEKRRAAGTPNLILSRVPDVVVTTVYVIRTDGSAATLIGDGTGWAMVRLVQVPVPKGNFSITEE